MSSDSSRASGFEGVVSAVDRLPLAPAVIGGIGTFASGYVLFVALLTASGNPNFSTPVRTLKQLGNLFYNAQNVPLVRHREIVVGDQTINQEATINLIQLSEPSLPKVVYYLVPVIVLAIAAALLATRYLEIEDPLETGIAVVGGLTLGYVLAALVGTYLFAQRTSLDGASETLSPEMLMALGYGVAYPLVIGTLVVGLVVGWSRLKGSGAARPSPDQA